MPNYTALYLTESNWLCAGQIVTSVEPTVCTAVLEALRFAYYHLLATVYDF